MSEELYDKYYETIKKHLMIPDAFGNAYSEELATEIVIKYQKFIESGAAFLMPGPDLLGVSTYADEDE